MAIDFVPVVSPTGCPTNSEANNEGVLEIAVGQETQFPLDFNTSLQVPLAVGIKCYHTAYPIWTYTRMHAHAHTRYMLAYICGYSE